MKKKLKIFFLFNLFFFVFYFCEGSCGICGGLIGGPYLVISNSGYGWLAPDEQVDADYNPATVNNIEGRRLFSAFSLENYFFPKNTSEFFGTNVFLVTSFDKLKCAARYKALLTMKNEKYFTNPYNIEYNTLMDDFEFVVFFGFPVKYNFKTGISAGINTQDYYFSKEHDLNLYDAFNKNFSRNYQIKAGMIFNINEFLALGGSIGGVFGAMNYFENNDLTRKDDNLRLYFCFLPELIFYKHDRTIILRSVLSLIYESILSEFPQYFLWINKDESYYNLNLQTGFGVYYELQDKTSLNCVIKYNQILNNRNKNYNINMINTTKNNGYDVSILAGIEKPVFVDLLFVRIGYNILKIKNYDYFFYKEHGAYLVSKYNWNEFEMSFLPDLTNNINFGVSIRFNNILFNMNFGKYLFYTYSYENNDKIYKTGFDVQLNFIFE